MERAAPTARQARDAGPERLAAPISAEPGLTDLRSGATSQRQVAEAAARSPRALAQRQLSAAARESPRSAAQRQLAADVQGGPRSVAQRARLDAVFGSVAANAARESGAVAQRMSIGGDPPLDFPKTLALVKEALGDGVDKKVLGKLVKTLQADTTAHLTREAAIIYVRSQAASFQAVLESTHAATAEGAETEEAAAAIIGGVVNRSHGRDVEWRMMSRKDVEQLKAAMKIEPGKATDQELFGSWKAVLEKFPAYNKVLSTPVDVYSGTTLALAGGLGKFTPGTSKLTPTSADRVNQLILLAGMLEYETRLVFSKKVSCEQCDQVASDYGIDVEHLEDT